MTGDVDEECPLLQISHLESPISSAASVSIRQPITSTSLINSRMTIEDNCIYTAAISSNVVGSLPEGTVLQIMPDSTIVALAVKNLPVSNESSIVFKDSSFPVESNQNTLNLSNLLTETADNNEQRSVDVPACSEENMSDIDLSFLNETEENNAIADPKCLNENAIKELQGMIADVSSHSLNLLQSNLNLSDSNTKSSQEQVNSEPTKTSNDTAGDVVMIDVSKPIQLSQNSLIMVNGQKCILQQDPQTGQVIAYPVKEQDKPHRKRGRPRKISMEQTTEINQTENAFVRDMESLSEDEREKGLLQIVNDDGALVRRSSRKRKRAKILRDYETGNLKQELGSDVDDIEVLDKDAECCARRKKVRGPGRPRKYMKTVDNVLDDNVNNGEKRQRGRPKKIVAENEPTQAFLVHTADGQVLMMQVPLSSIPPGITLQEMAQEIANKLNLGLNQTNKVPLLNEKDISIKELHTESDEETVENIPEVAKSVPELALQDHSIGSTTNCLSIQAVLNSADENSNIVDGSCQDMINNMNHIIGDPVCESEEVILESENCVKDSILPENVSENQNKLDALEVPQCSEDNFCINIQSATTPIDSTSMLCSLDDSLIDHDFGLRTVSKSLKENCKQIQASEISMVSKELFDTSDILKDKVNLQLDTESNINPQSQNINIEELLNRNVNSENSDKLILSANKFKHLNMTYCTDLIDHQKPCTEKQYIIQQISNIVSSDQVTKNVFKSVVAEDKTNMGNVCLESESVIESVECNNVINSKYLSPPQSTEAESADKSTSQFIKPDATNSENQAFEIILPLQKVSSLPESSIPNENTIASSTSTTLSEKVPPMFIPVQVVEESKNCKICQMPYFTDEEIIEHFKVKHPKCICTECNYINEHPYVIKRHAFRHTNHGCVCKICNKSYKDLYILKMHIKMVHLPPDILYACEICEKKFTRKAHLKRHLRIHAPIKQYQCPHCDYKGCEKSDITKHLLIHEEPKFKCEVCGKAFRHAKNKELHLKRHSGQRDYKCAACGFFGYTYTDIRKHIERRHALSCSHCKQVFTDVEFLKGHKRVGTCQPNLLEENKSVKIEGSSNVIVDDKETALLDEMPLDLLEADQPQAMTISECSEETLSALQHGQLIMTSVEGILNSQNGHLIVQDSEEDNIITSDNLSVLSVEKDSNKMITLIRRNGRNLSLKNCSSLALECITTVAENSISEPFILTNESEPAS